MKLAYLINYYPAPSHTFIRREVAALRSLGIDPLLISIRSFPDILPDPRDARDKTQTFVVLEQPFCRLSWAVVRLFIRHPMLAFTGLRRAIRQYRQAGRNVAKPLGYFAEACVVRRLLKQHGIEHLHVHMGTNAAAVAQIVRWLAGPVYSLTIHGPEEFEHPEGLCLREKFRDARFVVAVSEGRCEQLRATYSVERRKIHLVRCGIDADFAQSTQAQNILPDCAKFVSVGRLCARKNHETLIAAVDRVRRVRPDVQLDIIGHGERFAVLSHQIQRLGLGKHVRLLGTLSSDDVGRQLAEARALVIPSLSETLPCVIMEAFAMQRPVIAADVGSVTELVLNGKNGWIVDATSSAAVAAAMIEALETPVDRLKQMGACGAAMVAEVHDATRQARELLQLFQGTSMTSSHRPAATLTADELARATQ